MAAPTTRFQCSTLTAREWRSRKRAAEADIGPAKKRAKQQEAQEDEDEPASPVVTAPPSPQVTAAQEEEEEDDEFPSSPPIALPLEPEDSPIQARYTPASGRTGSVYIVLYYDKEKPLEECIEVGWVHAQLSTPSGRTFTLTQFPNNRREGVYEFNAGVHLTAGRWSTLGLGAEFKITRNKHSATPVTIIPDTCFADVGNIDEISVFVTLDPFFGEDIIGPPTGPVAKLGTLTRANGERDVSGSWIVCGDTYDVTWAMLQQL